MDMTGKAVLITGASRGIGAAAGRVFADAGAKVALVARSRAAIEGLAAEIGDAAIAIAADVSDYAQVAIAVESCRAAFGGLDVLIGNAGVIEPISALEASDPDGWGHAIDINLKGVYYGMRAAMPGMIAQGHGTIITVNSSAAHKPRKGWSHYCASKAGAAMLTRNADLEARGHGLRIMGLSPGTVATEMQRAIKKSGMNPVSELDWEDHIPPEWPAKALLWMCSPEADEHMGTDISLRAPEIRAKVGLA